MSEIINSLQEVYDKIMAADMLLVGLGEEFNGVSALKSISGYQDNVGILELTGEGHLIPAYQRALNTEYDKKLMEVLVKFADMIRKKNHYIVSTSTNDCIRQIPWREERLVMPCGGSVKKQCSKGCEDVLVDITSEEKDRILAILNGEGTINDKATLVSKMLGTCPVCGEHMIFNNVYASEYSEKGYLADWQIYTKWLGGSLARNIVILELGVGLKFPSVIRWPFEKIAFYQEKSCFYRVHETLYQMSPELKERGRSFEMSAFSFLEELCKLDI